MWKCHTEQQEWNDESCKVERSHSVIAGKYYYSLPGGSQQTLVYPSRAAVAQRQVHVTSSCPHSGRVCSRSPWPKRRKIFGFGNFSSRSVLPLRISPSPPLNGVPLRYSLPTTRVEHLRGLFFTNLPPVSYGRVEVLLIPSLRLSLHRQFDYLPRGAPGLKSGPPALRGACLISA